MLHAQDDGGGGSGMQDMWNLHWRSQKVAVYLFGQWWMKRWCVPTWIIYWMQTGWNAPDGIMGPQGKEGSFNALREIFCPYNCNCPAIACWF